MKKNIALSILIATTLATSPVAKASGRGEIIQKLGDFFGMVKDDAGKWTSRKKKERLEAEKQAKMEADREASGQSPIDITNKTPYEKAIIRGEIKLAEAKLKDDSFLTDPSLSGVFSSLKHLSLVRSVGQEKLIENMLSAIHRKLDFGFALIGERGSGKSQLVETIEYAFRVLKAQNPLEKNHVLKIDMSKGATKTLESFERVVANLRNNPDFKNSGRVVFYFENMDFFVNKAKGSGNDGSEALYDYLMALKGLEDTGVKVSFATEMNSSAYKTLVENTRVAKVLAPIGVRATDDAPSVDRILRNNQLLQDPHNHAKMDDQKYSRLFTWLNKYMPSEKEYYDPNSIVARGLQILDDARGSRAALLKYEILDEAADEVSHALRRDIEKLERQIMDAESFPADAAAAQKFLKEARPKMTELEAQLVKSTEEFELIKVARIEMAKIEKELSELPAGSTEKAKELTTQLKKARADASALSERDLAIEISRRTGADLGRILADTGKMTVKQFFDRMNKEVYGLDRVKALVMKMITRVDEAIRNKDFTVGRALSSMFFFGPPGNGKTTLARLIGEFMNGYKRLDAIQYKEPAWLSRLTGSAPGYADNEKGGSLINFIRQYRQINLHVDEFERGSAEFIELLQQILNPAQLTDGNDLTAELYESIVTMTSNLIRKLPDDMDPYDPSNLAAIKQMLIDAAAEKGIVLDPAVLNRIDYFVYVPELSRDTKFQILHKQVRIYNDTSKMKNKFMELDVTKSARERVTEEVVKIADSSARDVERKFKELIQDSVESAFQQGQFTDPLTGELKELSKRIRPGDLIEVDFDDAKGFSIRRVPTEEVL